MTPLEYIAIGFIAGVLSAALVIARILKHTEPTQWNGYEGKNHE